MNVRYIAIALTIISTTLVSSDSPRPQRQGIHKVELRTLEAQGDAFVAAHVLQLKTNQLNVPLLKEVEDKLIKECYIHFRKPQTRIDDVHPSGVNGIGVHEDGTIFSVGEDGTIKCFSNYLPTKEPRSLREQFFYKPEHGGQALLSLAVGQVLLATGGYNNKVRLWDIEKKECIQTLSGHTQQVASVGLLNGNKVVSATSDNTVKLWDIETAQLIRNHLGHGHPETRVIGVKKNDLYVTTGWDGVCKIHTLTDKKPIHCKHFDCPFRAVAMNDTETYVALGAFSGMVYLWNIPTDTIEAVVNYQSPITSLSFNCQGTQLLVNGGTKPLGLYDVATTDELGAIIPHPEFVREAVMAPSNNEVILGTGDGAIELWQVPKIGNLQISEQISQLS